MIRGIIVNWDFPFNSIDGTPALHRLQHNTTYSSFSPIFHIYTVKKLSKSTKKEAIWVIHDKELYLVAASASFSAKGNHHVCFTDSLVSIGSILSKSCRFVTNYLGNPG